MNEVPPMFGFAMQGMAHLLDAAADGRHPEMQFIAGSFIFWAVSLDDGLRDKHLDYEDRRKSDPDGQVIPGLRLARNAVTHGQLMCARERGMTFPTTIPFDFGPWVWRPLDELLRTWTPQSNSFLPAQKDSYTQGVAMQPIVDPLSAAYRWLQRFTP